MKSLSKIVRNQPFYILKLILKLISPYTYRSINEFVFKSKKLNIKWSTKAYPDLLTRHMLFFGSYQDDVLDSLDKFLSPGDVMLDVGAHHGLMTIFASKKVGKKGKVISFEPNMDARKILDYNLRINNTNNVTIIPIGLMNKTGIMKFYPQKGLVSWNSSFMRDFVSQNEIIKPVLVRVQTLDKFVFYHGITPDLIKIDVEGSEIFVLEGSKRTIKRYKPIIIMEFNELSARKAGTSIKKIVRYLHKYHYQLFTYKKGFWWWLLGEFYKKELVHYNSIRKEDLYNVICVPKNRLEKIGKTE